MRYCNTWNTARETRRCTGLAFRGEVFGGARRWFFGRICAFGDCAKNNLTLFRQEVTLDHAESKDLFEFARYLRVNFVLRGYFFYVTGKIPVHKDPTRTDAKIAAQYGLDISKWARARRRKQGVAAVQYLRFGREFVILATHGKHPFFQGEASVFRDIRRVPMAFLGEQIGLRKVPAGKLTGR